MKDREKQIQVLQDILINNGVFNNLVCRQDYANPDALISDLCHETAAIIYDNNYRKMDEVTLRIDLGDRTPEEINEIMEKFRVENATPIYAGVSPDELFELLKMLAENGDGKDYHASSVQFLAQNTIDYIKRLKEYAKAMECAYTTTLNDLYQKRNDEGKIYKQVAKEILQDWYNDVVRGMGEDGTYIIERAKKYGVEVDE